MKKKLWIMALAIGLLMLAGCGQKFIKSGDADSKYPYGWVENKDGTATVRIKGRWDKDCVWRSEYDESILRCEPGKKKGSFVVGSCNAGADDLFLRLYRQGQEDWEYALRLSMQGNGSGGVIVLGSGHEEPVKEGSYDYFNLDDRTIFMVNTAHSWSWHNIGEDIRVDRTGNAGGAEQFILTANTSPVQQAVVQLYDTQSPLTLTVIADIDENGAVNITEVQENSEVDYTEIALKRFWEKMGFAAPLSDAVTVRSANVAEEKDEAIYGVGKLEVTIGGNDYTLCLSLLPDITELRVPRDSVDPVTGETIAVSVTETEIGLEPVRFYQQESSVTAIWEHFGCYYVLQSRATDVFTMEKAAAALMGVETGG